MKVKKYVCFKQIWLERLKFVDSICELLIMVRVMWKNEREKDEIEISYNLIETVLKMKEELILREIYF